MKAPFSLFSYVKDLISGFSLLSPTIHNSLPFHTYTNYQSLSIMSETAFCLLKVLGSGYSYHILVRKALGSYDLFTVYAGLNVVAGSQLAFLIKSSFIYRKVASGLS